MALRLLLLHAVLLLLRPCFAASPWPPSAFAAARALAARLTAPEKLSLLYGVGWNASNAVQPWTSYVGLGAGVARVGLPQLRLEDGPQGVADNVLNATMYPCALNVASTWDVAAAEAFGAAMGVEQRGKGSNVLLGPDVNLARVPWAGRVFESFGEDAHVATATARAVIRGTQAQRVCATVKHLTENSFVSPNTESGDMSMNVGRRAHKSMYMRAFCGAVDEGVCAAMCAYNRVNNTFACQSPTLIASLKEGCGFAGWLMSDWGATHASLPSALAGLDQSFPDGTWFNASLAAAWAAGTLPAARLDDMVLRQLVPLFAAGVMADPPSPERNLSSVVTSAAHTALARSLAEASIVLLRNEGGLLPLDATRLRTLAVFGDNATVASGVSGRVLTDDIVTPLQGFARALPGVRVTYMTGYDAAAAAALAAASDAAIVVVATPFNGSNNRADLSLPPWADALVTAVAAAQPATVVVVRAPGAVVLPWLASARAVLFEGMAGQESGASIAATVLGRNNPAGRLAVSFPQGMQDTWLSAVPGGPIDPKRFPGTDRGRGWAEVDFDEGLAMGYRWFDATNRTPHFAFGFGLSYSAFVLSGLRVDGAVSAAASATVHAHVQHTGGPAGASIVQVYARYPAACDEPLRLVSYAKVALAPGGAQDVSFTLSASDVAVFDVVSDAFELCGGAYTLYLAASSRDFHAQAQLTVA